MLSHAAQRLHCQLESAGSLSIPSIVLDGPFIEVGSHPDCAVVLPYHGVASRHCVFRLQEGELSIESHSPMTWLNDDPVRESALRNGDRLVIGPVQLRVVIRREAEAVENQAAGPRSESIFDDDEDESAADPTGSSADQSIPRTHSRTASDDSASAESHILSSHDTVVLDRSLLALDLANSGPPTGDAPPPGLPRLAALAESTVPRQAVPETMPTHAPMVTSPEVPVSHCEISADTRPETSEILPPQSRMRDLHKYLDERCQLLDERESELHELYAEVSARRSQLLQQQQHWEVLCRAAVAPVSTDEIEQADRRAQAARQLAEQQELLEALRRELHLRDSANRELRKQIGELEDELDQLSSQLELLREKESLHQRGTEEFDKLASLLESESQAIAQRREELRLAEQHAQAALAEWECRKAELDATSQELDREMADLQCRRGELEQLSARLAARDGQLSQAEFSLTARVSALDQREQQIVTQECELSERLQALAQLQKDIDDRSRELEVLRCSLTTDLQDMHHLQHSLQEQQDYICGESERLDQQRDLLDAHEQTLVDRESALRNLESRLEQNLADLASREAEASQRSATLESQLSDLQARETSLADARREHEAILQTRDEIAAARIELDRLRQQFESEQQAWAVEVHEQRQQLRSQHDEFQAERQRQEQELVERFAQLGAQNAELNDREQEVVVLRQQFESEQQAWAAEVHEQRQQLRSQHDEFQAERQRQEQELVERFEQLEAQNAELNDREQEVVRMREDLERQLAERAAVADHCDSLEHHHNPQEQELLQRECEAWQQRLALVEQSLAERLQELDAAEQRIEQQRQELELCWSNREAVPSMHNVDDRLLHEGPSSSRLAEAIDPTRGFHDSEHHTAATETAVCEESAANVASDEEPQVQDLRHHLAELFGIEATHAPIRPDSPSTDVAEDAQLPAAGIQPVHASTPESHTESHPHDTVDSYWKLLLDRNRQDQAQAQSEKIAVKAGETSGCANHPLPSPTSESENAPAVIVSSWQDQDQRGRALDQDDRDALRAHMSSLRAVANQSARSAVAKHVSKQMTLQYHVKGVITLISGVVCIVLLTSPMWSNIHYIEPGIAALVVTAFMGTLLWFDYLKLVANEDPAPVADDESGDPTEKRNASDANDANLTPDETVQSAMRDSNAKNQGDHSSLAETANWLRSRLLKFLPANLFGKRDTQ